MTLGALFVGAALLGRARGDMPRVRGGAFRWPAVAAVLVVGLFSLYTLVANRFIFRTGGSTSVSARDRAAAWAPWSPVGWARLGDVQSLQDDYTGARASYRKAIALDRNDYLTWLHLALASSGPARATAAREALRLNPLSPEINSLRPYLGLPAQPGTKPAAATSPATTTPP